MVTGRAWRELVRADRADGGGGVVHLGDVAVRGGQFEVWAFVGSGVKTERFQTVQEAVTWAGQYGEWVVYEKATMGWRAIRHSGERGKMAAGASA